MQGRGKSMGKCEGGQRVLRALREGLGDAPLGLSSALSCFLLCISFDPHTEEASGAWGRGSEPRFKPRDPKLETEI